MSFKESFKLEYSYYIKFNYWINEFCKPNSFSVSVTHLETLYGCCCFHHRKQPGSLPLCDGNVFLTPPQGRNSPRQQSLSMTASKALPFVLCCLSPYLHCIKQCDVWESLFEVVQETFQQLHPNCVECRFGISSAPKMLKS